MRKKSKEAKGKLEQPQALLRALLSSVDTTHGANFSAGESSVISVPADDANRFHNLRSRSQDIIIIS